MEAMKGGGYEGGRGGGYERGRGGNTKGASNKTRETLECRTANKTRCSTWLCSTHLVIQSNLSLSSGHMQ